jgi:hypothetical protein
LHEIVAGFVDLDQPTANNGNGGVVYQHLSTSVDLRQCLPGAFGCLSQASQEAPANGTR